MNAKLFLSRTAALVAGALFALSGLARAAEADALPTFTDNYIKFSGIAPWSTGSSAAFQQRAQYSHDGAGGIEAFSYGQELSKVTSYQLDGKALPGAGDYLAQFKVTKNEVGSFEGGYKRFRTFYDGAGGFFPQNNAWLPIYPRGRYIDRAKVFAHATIALPKEPVYTFKYSNELRNGTKNSTIWGDSDFTGIPINYGTGAVNPVSATRKLLPAYIQVGERTEEWEASVRQTVGNTTASLALIGTRINNNDSRTIDRYTGELRPYPFPTSTTPRVLPPEFNQNPNKGADAHGFKENALTWLGKLETKLSDSATVFAELSYRHATGDTTDSRLITASIATATGVKDVIGGFTPPASAGGTGTSYGRPPYSYTAAGSFKSDVTTGVVGLRTSLTKEFEVDLALRGEHYKFDGNSAANYVSNLVVLTSGVVTPVPVATASNNKISEKPWTPALDVRYTGIPALPLYASWDYRTLKQDERSNYGAFTVNTTTGALTGPTTPAADNIKEHHSNFKFGANWTPNRAFNLRPEVFTKDHENRFEGYGTSAGSYYILDYDIYGARVTAIVRPLPVLSFNTRYIVQRGKSALAENGFAKGDSNDSHRTQLSETIDWVPSQSVYFQTSVNLVYDTIRTSYPRVTGAAQYVVHNADNNYWNGSFLTGFVVDKETDAQIQATYYKADNYDPALAAQTQPFGAGGTESTITVGVKHKFSDRMIGSVKLGYFDSKTDTVGSNANFRGPLAYLSLEYRL